MPWTLLGADHDGHLCTSDRLKPAADTVLARAVVAPVPLEEQNQEPRARLSIDLALSLALKPQNPGK